MESLESLGLKGFRRRFVYDTIDGRWDVDWERYCSRGRGELIDWTLPVYTGVTLAHLAARSCRLPPGFSNWGISDYRGRTVAHICARLGTLPEDFKEWELADVFGWSVAHEFVSYRQPRNFGPREWAICDNVGWSVAHQAARTGHLPPDFNEWDLVDGDGRSVAYEAALYIAESSAAADVPWDIEGPISRPPISRP